MYLMNGQSIAVCKLTYCTMVETESPAAVDPGDPLVYIDTVTWKMSQFSNFISYIIYMHTITAVELVTKLVSMIFKYS